MIGFIIGYIVGAVITVLIFVLYRDTAAYGTLRIDRSNPEKDIYRLDIDDLYSLEKKKEIVLKIDNQADLSRK